MREKRREKERETGGEREREREREIMKSVDTIIPRLKHSPVLFTRGPTHFKRVPAGDLLRMAPLVSPKTVKRGN